MVNYNRIRERTYEVGLSIAFVCTKMGVGRGYINDAEKEGRAIPDDRLAVIASLINTTVEYLKDETDEKEKPALNDESGFVGEGVEIFRRLSDEKRRRAISYLRFLEKEETDKV